MVQAIHLNNVTIHLNNVTVTVIRYLILYVITSWEHPWKFFSKLSYQGSIRYNLKIGILHYIYIYISWESSFMTKIHSSNIGSNWRILSPPSEFIADSLNTIGTPVYDIDLLTQILYGLPPFHRRHLLGIATLVRGIAWVIWCSTPALLFSSSKVILKSTLQILPLNLPSALFKFPILWDVSFQSHCLNSWEVSDLHPVFCGCVCVYYISTIPITP